MDRLRLFIAINFPPIIKEAIDKFKINLYTSEANIKWVEEENLHLTLKFLGDTPKGSIPAIDAKPPNPQGACLY